jgi:hypothetical protein
MSTETLGQRAAEALKAAKIKAKDAGKELPWEEVAAIIDRCAGLSATTESVRKADSGQSCAPTSDFGDRRKIPPTPEQVTAYSAAIGYPVDGQKWCDAYAVKGWKVGSARMKDWQAAVRNWKANKYGLGKIAKADAGGGATRDYGRI